jgi:hypothetical protein
MPLHPHGDNWIWPANEFGDQGEFFIPTRCCPSTEFRGRLKPKGVESADARDIGKELGVAICLRQRAESTSTTSRTLSCTRQIH